MTHNLSTPPPEGNDHLDGFPQFFRDLNQAIRSTLSIPTKQYDGVYVLLISWEEDDLGTISEIEALSDVLRNIYNYSTEHYSIPSYDPELALDEKLHEFRRNYGHQTSNLLIVYYGGHGELETRQQPSRSIWTAFSGGPSLIWSDLQPIIQRSRGDIVFMLDCCYAATATRGGGSMEGLWASNSETEATGVNDNSFTRNLIEELKAHSAKPFSIPILHNRLMNRFKRRGPHQLLVEPWYTYLGDRMSPSIQLSPLVSDHNPDLTETSSQGSGSSEPALTDTLVLFAARLKDSAAVPSLEDWTTWLRDSLPKDVDYAHTLGRVDVQDVVRMEANFLSHSALVLVSMPIFLWNRMRTGGGYSFVGFVKSHNRIVPPLKVHEESREAPLTRSGIEGGARKLIKGVYQGIYKGHEDVSVVEVQKLKLHNTDKSFQASDPTGLIDSFITSLLEYAFLREGANPRKWLLEFLRQQAESEGALSCAGFPAALIYILSMASLYVLHGKSKLALEIFEHLVGLGFFDVNETHPYSMFMTGNLATAMWCQGNFAEAERLEARLLEFKMSVLGSDNASILGTKENLALTYARQARWDKATEVRASGF